MPNILYLRGARFLVCTPLYELKGHWALGLFAKCMCNVAHPWFIRLTRFHTVVENRHDNARADVRPRVKNCGGEVTKAKARKDGPSKILTLFRKSASEPT